MLDIEVKPPTTIVVEKFQTPEPMNEEPIVETPSIMKEKEVTSEVFE